MAPVASTTFVFSSCAAASVVVNCAALIKFMIVMLRRCDCSRIAYCTCLRYWKLFRGKTNIFVETPEEKRQREEKKEKLEKADEMQGASGKEQEEEKEE